MESKKWLSSKSFSRAFVNEHGVFVQTKTSEQKNNE